MALNPVLSSALDPTEDKPKGRSPEYRDQWDTCFTQGYAGMLDALRDDNTPQRSAAISNKSTS